MKKLILSILFALVLIISIAQPAKPCGGGIVSTENNYHFDQFGYLKIFDCDKWTEIKTESCSVEIYMKVNPGNIDFMVKSDATGYKMFLYDIFGRKLVEKDLKCETTFKKEGLTNGLYFIKITDGTQVFTKRINL